MTKVFSWSFERIVKASYLLELLMPSFLKELIIVSFDALFQQKTKNYITSIIEMFEKGLFLSKTLMHSLAIHLRWCTLKLQITPCFIGWTTEDIGGRNINLILLRFLICRWVEQLSTKKCHFSSLSSKSSI